MTNLGDVVRQIETALGDPHYPPTGHERVVYISILLLICNGAVDAKGSR